MPIYEYQCQACGNKCEIMHRMSEGPSKDCGECGSANLKKLISAVGFKLKGTGWYETDFKTGDQRNLAGDSDKKPAKTSTDVEKPAKKTETKKKSTPGRPGSARQGPKKTAKTRQAVEKALDKDQTIPLRSRQEHNKTQTPTAERQAPEGRRYPPARGLSIKPVLASEREARYF